jgi:AcrB/AcrD/AcrF family protein
VQTAFGGTVVTQVLEGERSFDLAVKLRPQAVANPHEMRAIPLFGSNNEIITLGQVADVQAFNGFARIYREENERGRGEVSLDALECRFDRRTESDANGAGSTGLDLWKLLVSAHVRRRGYNPDAQDLTQSFFLHLLERRGLTQVDPHKGRFRSFLLASLQNFLSVAQHLERRIKRGGLCKFISLDAETLESRYQLEPADDSAFTAEQIFDVRWALTLLNKARTSVQRNMLPAVKERFSRPLRVFCRAEAQRSSCALMTRR